MGLRRGGFANCISDPVFAGASGFWHHGAGATGRFRIGIPTPTSVLQFNSGTNHPELAHIPQVKGSILHTTATPIYGQLATNLGALWFSNLLEQLTEISKDLKVLNFMELIDQ